MAHAPSTQSAPNARKAAPLLVTKFDREIFEEWIDSVDSNGHLVIGAMEIDPDEVDSLTFRTFSCKDDDGIWYFNLVVPVDSGDCVYPWLAFSHLMSAYGVTSMTDLSKTGGRDLSMS